MMRLGILMLACLVWGCGEREDELGPYIEKLKGMQKYNETLLSFKEYLKTEGMTDKAKGLSQLLKDYQVAVTALGAPKDKHIRALHNEMARALKEGIRKAGEPDSPTFVPSAQKSVRYVEEEIVTVYNNFERLWKKEGKTGPFPLKWPQKE